MPVRQLTEAELHQFEHEGYVVAEEILPPDELQPVIDELTHEIDVRAHELLAEGELTDLHADAGFETRLALLSRETSAVADAIWSGVLHGPAIFRLITNPRLLAIAEQLAGPEIVASSVYRLRPKIPHYGRGEVPWHQDSGYFEPYCDNDLVVTMWLPLVDATVANGCLYVIPGSHRSPVVRHTLSKDGSYLQIDPKEFPRTGKRVACPVTKGGVLLMTNRTAHASFANTTEQVRWSMDLRYQNAALPTNAGITRFPREAVFDAASGVPVACYPPEADFLVRSRLRPAEVVTDPARFMEIREKHEKRSVTDRFGLRGTEAVTAG